MEKTVDWDLPAPTGEEAILDPYANVAPTVSLSDDVAEKRALKAKIAFSGEPNPPSYEEILNDVKTNREDRLRDRLAQSESIKKQQLKQQLIREVVDKGDASPEATTFLQGLSADEIVDPEGQIEKKYAEWRMNMGLTSDETGTVDAALQEDPDGVNERIDSSVDRLYRKERSQALRERLDALYQQTGVFRTVVDFAADMLPGFTALEDRNVTPDNVNNEGLYPGEIRRSQIRDLFAMPQKEFDATLAKLEQDAQASGDYWPVIKFLDAVNEYAQYDAQVDNTFALLSLVELAPGGLVFDAATGGARLASATGRKLSAAEARRAAKEAVEGVAGSPAPGEAPKAPRGAPKASGEAPASAEPNLSPKEEALSDVADAVTEAQTGFKPTRTDWTDEPFEVKEVASKDMPVIRSKKTGIAAIVYGRPEKGKPHQISINAEKLQEAFDKKMWVGKDGFLPDGARAFPEDAFKSVEEFKNFLIQHELAHIDVGRQKGRALASMEDEVTREALARIGRKDLLRKMFPEIFSKKVSGPDPDVVPAPPKVSEVSGSKASDGPHIVVDIPNPRTGGEAQVQVPATPQNLARIHTANTEAAAIGMGADDLPNVFAAGGDADRAAMAEAISRLESAETVAGRNVIKDQSAALARKLPSLLDPFGAVVGRAKHSSLYKLALKKANQYEAVLKRQMDVNKSLMKAFLESQTMGALRWSDDVFEAVKDAMRAQMDRYVKSPSSAVLDVKYLREWETGPTRTNQIIYTLGKPDGTFFDTPEQATVHAKDFYGLADDAFSVEMVTPGAFTVRVAKVIDETDPSILSKAIQTLTETPMSWTGAWLPYLRGSAGVSSEHLQKNLAVSAHHAKALHEAFMVAARDIGQLSKKELRNLDALMEAKRDVEKIVIDPVSGKEKKVRGEWFNNASELEKTYKRAFGEFPSDNVVSAYFTMRQMYDFDLMHRNFKLYSAKVRLGIENAKLHVPIPDDKNPGMVKWLPMKKGVEVKFLDEMPSGNFDVLILNADTAQANLVSTAKSGTAGIKDLQSKGYRVMQIANPNERPLKMVNDNYVQFIVAKDVERIQLTPDQLPATEGGHVRYREGFYVKQPRFEVTSNGDKLYTGDRSIIGASSEAEAAKHASNIEIGRQLMLKGDFKALKDHLGKTLPWSVGQFEELFRPKLGPKGEVLEEALLDKDTPITWVADGQGTNDAAKTHAGFLKSSFDGVRDTIDDPTNIYGVIDKKYTGEKDFALSKIVRGENGKLFDFEKARMISPMETLEQAWAEISRSMATDDLKVQATTNWVEEAAEALETPIEELRRNPWAALNNPQWNRQYGDIARIRTLNAQRRQILEFLGQRDALGSTLDWVRNKLLNSVYERKGQAAADWVDDHVLPNVRNPLQFMRSFAFHTKMGFFNPVQLFLQANTMLNTWAITGNPLRVGSSLSGVMLMQMSRVNRTPEVLKALGKKAEKLGWKAGEWEEMDELFHKLSLHIVEGEVGTLDIMTSPKMFEGVGGKFLDKGLVFFREGERAVRMNSWAVAYKEFRDKFPTKVLNNSDINTILRRQEILAGNMSRGSNALWQKGLTGPMTQFWGYQARIMEQLLGKQLTRAEKLRLGSTFAAMYGIPVSLSAATMFQIPGWSTDDLRQYALENGIDVNSGLGSVAMNGIPAELIRWMTSDENGQGGLLLGIGDRYGPGGLAVLKNLVEAKDGVADAIIDLAFGASGSITRDFFKHVLPDDWDIIESASNAPKLTLTDYANMFSTISTVNNTTKLYWALTTHKNMTRDGLSLGDKSPVSAWISFTTGLDEQRFKDTFLKIDSMKDLKTATDELGKEYVKLIRQAKLLPIGSDERNLRIRKARALLEGLDPKDVKRFVKQAYKSSDDLETSVDQNFKKKFKE